MQIALFLPNWLGDVVMSTPALRAIRRRFSPPARIVGILRPHLAELLAGTNFLDDSWHFDPRSSQPEHRRWALVRRMRQTKFDLALLLTNSFHTALLAWLGGARRRVGYARDGRSLLLSQRVAVPRKNGRIVPTPGVQSALDLATAVGCESESPRLELATTPSEEQLADEAWRSLGLRTDGQVIALNGSGAYGASKLWPASHFSALAQKIARQLDHDVLVVCGPQEREMARQIAAAAQHPRVFSLANQPLGMGLTKACLRRVRLAVSTDSGPRHIAAAFGKPVITLLGPTLPIWIHNPTVRAIDLQLPLECIGCYARRCPLGHHRCMTELSPEMVFAAVTELLADRKAVAA